MNIKAFFVLPTVLSLLLLFANIIDARKDLRELRRIVVKNPGMPAESTQGLIPEYQASTITKTKAYCHTHEDSEHTMEKPFVNKNFELMPDLSIYDNGIKPTKKKPFAKDFELMPDLSIYDNDTKPTKKGSYAKDFELKADISIHEPTEQKSVVSSTDPQPGATIYHN